MSELIVWKNQAMSKLRKDLDHLINRCWDDLGASLFVGNVAADISVEAFETKDALIVKAELPDLDRKDLDISLSQDKLTIKGKRRVKIVREGSYYNTVERLRASFSRTVRIPFRVRIEGIEATFRQGVLEVVLPKWRPRKAHFIKIEIM
jgi:HSP20 family protein